MRVRLLYVLLLALSAPALRVNAYAPEVGAVRLGATRLTYDGLGRLTNITYQGYVWSYTYDDVGRVTGIDAPEGGYSYTWLEGSFKPLTLTRPNGIVSSYHYDSLKRLKSIEHGRSGALNPVLGAVYDYDDGDRRTREAWNNGRDITYGYDNAHQLLSVSSPARPSDNSSYEYDAAGNIESMTLLGLERTFTYGYVDEVATATAGDGALTVLGEVNFNSQTVLVNGVEATLYGRSFEAAGVAVTQGVNTLMAVFTGPEELPAASRVATAIVQVTVGPSTSKYDVAGNTTEDARFRYYYNAGDQMTSVVAKAGGATVLACRYDALGRRLEAVRNGTNTERYVYVPGTFQVLAVLDATNGVKEVYTHGPDLSGTLGGAGSAPHRAAGSGAGGIGGILAVTTSAILTNSTSSTYWLHADALGNIVLATDSDGHQVATYQYSPFGQLINRTGEFDSRFLFSSKEYDRETGFLYFGYRYLNPAAGSWLSKDPVGISGGLNLYAFVGNNPVNFVDPLGLSTVRIHVEGGVVTLVDPSISEFRSAIRSQSAGSINRLDILGHGSRNQIVIEPGASGHGLIWVPGVTDQIMFTDTGESFSDLVRDRLSSDATVDLKGCNTAREGPFFDNQHITRQVSVELPGVTAVGSRGYGLGNDLSNPFNRDQYIRIGTENHVFRIPRSYRNGVQK